MLDWLSTIDINAPQFNGWRNAPATISKGRISYGSMKDEYKEELRVCIEGLIGRALELDKLKDKYKGKLSQPEITSTLKDCGWEGKKVGGLRRWVHARTGHTIKTPY